MLINIKNNLHIFLIILLIFLGSSLSIFNAKENDKFMIVNYSLSFDILNLINFLDDLKFNTEGSTPKNLKGAKNFDQLFFIIKNEAYSNEFVNNIEITDPRQKLPVFELRGIQVLFKGESDQKLIESVNNFNLNVGQKFKKILRNEILSKVLILKNNQDYRIILNTLKEYNFPESIIFNDQGLIQHIDNLNLIQIDSKDGVSNEDSLKTMIYYILISLIISIIVFSFYIALRYRSSW